MALGISRAGRHLDEHPVPEDYADVHIHELYELYCLISGDVEYVVEGSVYPLQPGDIIIVKNAEAHSIRIKSALPYEWITVQFSENMLIGTEKNELLQFLNDRPLGINNLFPRTKYNNPQWTYYMDQIRSIVSRARRQLYISVLLSELYEASRDAADVLPHWGRGVISDIINYLSAHATSPLQVDAICRRFYISRAQLNRKFRERTGCSVWEYITNKRLLLAQEMLRSGDSPAIACAKAGFNNYTTFYRAYRKKFGVSPKTDHRWK